MREQKPSHVAGDSEPIPDVSVVIVNARQYSERHPTASEARLVVEVADSSVERDSGEKAALYAQAGITDYWVSLVNTHQLVVHRGPTENGYASVVRLTETDTITPLAAPDSVISVADLLPRAAPRADAV